MSKSIIAPIVATLAIVIQFIFGVEIPQEVLDEVVVNIVNVTAVITVLYGIFKDHTGKIDK